MMLVTVSTLIGCLALVAGEGLSSSPDWRLLVVASALALWAVVALLWQREAARWRARCQAQAPAVRPPRPRGRRD
jgi:hypothetical protein